MAFRGDLIKKRAKEVGVTLQVLARRMGVSRQTVHKWIIGQTPRGSHLVRLCSALNLTPDSFFDESLGEAISVPLHRTVKRKPVTDDMRQASRALAEQYLPLFRQDSSVSEVPVVRMRDRSKKNALLLAKTLREKSGVGEGKPMDFASALMLLSKLGIYAIFREFPEEISKNSYAFFSKIERHRVVFINTRTNVLDLIFQLLHETVHAIRDEDLSQIENDDEEKFCDLVAETAQFPEVYAEMIACYVRDYVGKPGILINRLKEKSKENSHSLWGIVYRLEHMDLIKTPINVGGAATILNKEFPTIEEMVYYKQKPEECIDTLYRLSPLFISLVSSQMENVSIRKFGEWFGLSNSMDAKQLLRGLKRYQKDKNGEIAGASPM